MSNPIWRIGTDNTIYTPIDERGRGLYLTSDALDGTISYVTTGLTGTIRLLDAAGTAISGQSTTSLNYVAASNGVWYGTIAAPATALDDGDEVILEIEITAPVKRLWRIPHTVGYG